MNRTAPSFALVGALAALTGCASMSTADAGACGVVIAWIDAGHPVEGMPNRGGQPR